MRLLSCGLVLSCLVLAPAFSVAEEFKPEPGFTMLFNGKDMTGWKEEKSGDSLDGKAEAYKGRFTIKDGVVTIDPSVKGDVKIMTAREFAGDFQIRFEFKPDAKCNNDLFIRGQKFDLLKGNVKNIKQDEWNQFEIIVKGDKIEFKNNGEVQRTATLKMDSSNFKVRAEFGGVQIRHMRVMGGTK
jgi:hypothetical protein